MKSPLVVARPYRARERARRPRRLAAFFVIASLAGLASSITGCTTGFFLYELLKDDDDDEKKAPPDSPSPSPTATPAPTEPLPAPSTAPVPSSDAAVTTTCSVGEPCPDAGVCSSSGTCTARGEDGASCRTSWQCAGGYCAWDASKGGGICTSVIGACKRTTTGCTADDHACCEGSRCRPAAFGALAQCELCRIIGASCDATNADRCCSGTCSFGVCD